MKHAWMAIIVGFLVFGPVKTKAQVWKEYSSFIPNIGLQLGAQGIGVEGGYPLSNAFNVRIGAHIFPSFKARLGDRVFQLKRSSVNAFVDWQPLYGHARWFARKWIMSGGIGYFFENKWERFQGTTIESGQPKDYAITYSKLRPYVGTGLNGIRLSYRLNLAVNVGYFIPTTGSELTLYEMDPIELPALQDKLNSFPEQQLPGINVQVGISYVFIKGRK